MNLEPGNVLEPDIMPEWMKETHEYHKLITGSEQDQQKELDYIRLEKQKTYLLEDLNAELRLQGLGQTERVEFLRGLPDYHFVSLSKIKRLDARMNHLPQWIALKKINFRMRLKGIDIITRAQILGIFPIPQLMVKGNMEWELTTRELKRWDGDAPIKPTK